jgi:hypothetical protein
MPLTTRDYTWQADARDVIEQPAPNYFLTPSGFIRQEKLNIKHLFL